MRSYTSKELEEAADLCGTMASYWMSPKRGHAPYFREANWSDAAIAVAWRARNATDFIKNYTEEDSWALEEDSWALCWAEAEALLRTGWQPGYPVEAL